MEGETYNKVLLSALARCKSKSDEVYVFPENGTHAIFKGLIWYTYERNLVSW